jgi:EAL domain-containing protein (putative c-di-GMP-specific phosphodiesterase class I)
MLLDLDCDEIQGYLIARPMPASDVGAFLDTYPVATRSSSTICQP